MDFISEVPVPLFGQPEDFMNYFDVETETMAAPGYADSSEATLRQVAMIEIVKNYKPDKLDAFIPYLAMNYFDRFISRNQLPNVLGRVRDDTPLAAIACLTMAWKMRDPSFSCIKFLEDRSLNEYRDHLLDMELQILSGLEWRIRSVLPFCFVSFFLGKTSAAGIRRRVVTEIIIETQGDIGFTRFKPSVLAAGAVLVACQLQVREQDVGKQPHVRDRMTFINNRYVNQENLDRCTDKMLDMCFKKNIFVEGVEHFMEDVMTIGGESVVIRPSWFAKRSHDGEASSSSSRTLPNEPLTEIEELEEKLQINEELKFDFELKWLLGTNQPGEVTIDSPIFRPPPQSSDNKGDTDPAEAKDKTSLLDNFGRCFKLQN